jgi:dihydrofolate reductase
MRKIFLFMMVSVDGYFEGLNRDISWHNVDAEFNAFAHEQDASVDTLLFGHLTYTLMAGYWPKPEAAKSDSETARFMNETPKIVVSHTPFDAEWGHTTVLTQNIAEEVQKLKALPGKDIAIFGSNMLSVSLMEKGVIDEFRLMVNPVALGAGTPLFTGLPKRIKFKLNKVREFKSGNVLHYYTPAA